MKITLKGFNSDEKEETVSSNYRVLTEKMDWSVKGFEESKKARDDKLLKALWNLYQVDETTWAVVQAISTFSLGLELKG